MVVIYIFIIVQRHLSGELTDEFISSQHLDDLQCAFTSLKGFLAGGNDQSINVLACFDNEEVGSGTKQGAASTLLYDV